ncbi:MAG: type II secretion system F family protein [Burkholderiales bacterium]|nr:type II secretion system F family protein [Burkholderiales bacterium]
MLKNKPKVIKWKYSGCNMHGQLLSGVIESPSMVFVKVQLLELGIKVTTIERYSKLSEFSFRSKIKIPNKNIVMRQDVYNFFKELQSIRKQSKKIKTKIKEKEVIIFVKQFLVLLQSGVPLLRSFDIIINSTNNKGLVTILQDVKFSVGNGANLFDSFNVYTKVFDQLFLNFLAIGESGGVLEPLLIKYVEYKERTLAVKHKVKSAMVYPIVIILVAIFVLGIILGFIVPQFEEVFHSVGATLPTITLWIIILSKVILNYWWAFIVMPLFTVFGCTYLYNKNIRFRFFIDKYLLMVPIFGDLLQKTLISRWSRTLALLFAAGVPLNYALKSIAAMLNNYLYSIATLNIKQEIESGNSLYQSMLITALFPDMVNQMVAVGEESGSLDRLLSSIADYYDSESNTTVDTILSLIEPVTILCLGLILGIIIIAIYLPLFNLGNVLG